jgi:SulP family sulfate permease
MLIVHIVPFDNAQYARSVREDTAELASYALSDRGSSLSPPPRQRSSQTQLESYFTQPEDESVSSRALDGLHRDTILEISEPVTPETGPSSNKSPGTSVLTTMLRRSPPSTSPPNEAGHHSAGYSQGGDATEDCREEGRLIITSNGVRLDATERTPLLTKDTSFETHHPDWIRGEQDLERQDHSHRTWPKLQNVLSWSRERGTEIARTVLNPKRWNRKVIWQNAVVEPVGYLPAVTLGLLLNILDALSYGMSMFIVGFSYWPLQEVEHPSRFRDLAR